MQELNWGLPVILYLFLGGLGAGAGAVSAAVLLRGGGGDDLSEPSFDIARLGALIAPLPVIIGTGMLIFELSTFQAGHYFRFLNLFTTINLSPMSIGSWVLAIFIVVSLVYAYTFIDSNAQPHDAQQQLRKKLAWIMVPLGVIVAIYTGVLLGAMPARPFWNSPILALLFMISGLSTGVAAILLARAFTGSKKLRGGDQGMDHDSYLLTSSDLLLIGFEIVVIFLFIMYAHLTVGGVKEAISIILGGDFTTMFWLGFVVIGLVVPVLIEMKYVLPTLLYQKRYEVPFGMEVITCTLILVGGFMLRYVVVLAGQMTGSMGI